jgi:hypothetical protein
MFNSMVLFKEICSKRYSQKAGRPQKKANERAMEVFSGA